jgi:hypothetical protein
MTDPLDNVADAMPKPQAHAIEAQEAAAPKTIKDKSNVVFDPAIHEANSNGQPVFTVAGNFKKKRGRKAGPQSKSEINMPPPGNQAGPQIAESIFALGQIIGGEEWAPQKQEQYGIDERGQMYDAWTRYCEQNDIQEVPPTLAIVLCTAGYAVPRLFMPKTKSRLQKAKDWAAMKWIKWRGKKSNDTRSNSGGNGKRQDNSGKAALSEVSQ